MAEKKVTVDEEMQAKIDERTAKRKERDAKLREARDLVRSNYVMLEENLEKDLFAAISFIVGNKLGSGVSRFSAGRQSLDSLIAAKFVAVGVGGSVSDFDLFKEFKVGAERMRFFIIKMIKDAAPESRMWIKFNDATESYDYVANGPDIPEGWDGYLPKDESIL